jgi:phytoene dehydrogenase-like protein
MPEKSVVIVGAGMAGLSAGCYARMNGYRATILEMHNLPGGLCTAWQRKGYTFDGCIHWLIGSRSGAIHRFYEELGAVHGRRMHDPEEFLRFVDAGGRTFVVYSDLDRLEQHMKELAPADAEAIEELCKAARVLTRHEMPMDKPRELMGPADMFKALKAMAALRTMRKYGKVSVQEYASRFSDQFLREVFPLILDDMPGMPMVATIMAMSAWHERNGGRPIGGSLEFARAIERRYLGLGGEIQYQARVEKVLVENDRAVGVRLADGTEHRADIVISAADGRTTIFDMLDGRYVDDKVRGYYDKWPVHGTYVRVSLGVARDLSSEPHCVIFPVEEPVKVGDQMRRRLNVQHHCYDPTSAPPGKSAVTVLILGVNYEYWEKLHKDREQYKAEKQALADAVIDRLEKRFPCIREQVEVVDVATPMTYVRYTGNWKGSYMGWATTNETMDKTMRKTLPGLGSFYMAGQWVFMGGGIPGAIMSGRHLMQVICKKDKKEFQTSTP